MKVKISVLVVLICLIASNFVFAQNANNDVQTASVYWNFKVYDVIQPLTGGQDNRTYNILQGTSLTNLSDNMSVGFTGTPNAPITMTAGSGGSITMTPGSGATGSVTITVNVATVNTFNGSGEAYCDITITNITANATAHGTFTYTNTVTVEYQ
ncbi:MAG: hypothetical protein ACPL1A_06775 [Candidatus Kapaibacteriota bacterium]